MKAPMPSSSLAIYTTGPRFGDHPKPQPITASEIRLVSPDGNVQGVLAANESGVQLRSADGETRYSFDGDSFTMTRREKPVFALTAHKEGKHSGGNISLFSSDGMPNAIMGIHPNRREGFVQVGRTMLTPQEHHDYRLFRQFTPEKGDGPMYAIRRNRPPQREYTVQESLGLIAEIASIAGFKVPLPIKL